MTKLLRWCNLTLILLTLLSYFSPFISPEKLWLFSFFGLLYPWLLLGNFLFIIYWTVRKDRYFLFSFICILLGWHNMIGFIGFNTVSGVDSDKALKVATYNLGRVWNLRDSRNIQKHEKAKSSFFHFKEGLKNTDIFCAQEISNHELNWFSDSLGFPYFVHYYKNVSTTFIFSKKPPVNSGIIKFQNHANSCIWADFNISGKTFRVYNIHLQSNKISDKANEIAKDGDLKEKETWKNVREVLKKYKNAAQIRARQAEKTARHIAQCPHPVILCGDLNDTPLSYPYQVFAENFQDTFTEKGRGIGTTYAGSIPALRIDFIFADQNFEILNHEILDEDLSDHYPVVGTLKIKEK